jgi:hypothetical protein
MLRYLLVVVAMVSISSSAHAEKVGGMQAGGAAMVVLPQGDAEDMSDTSLGIRGTFVYWAHKNVGAVGSFEYIFVNEKDNLIGDEVSLTFYSINVGARFTTSQRTKLQPFGEVMIGRHTSIADTPFGDTNDSDIGFRLGGGVLYRFQPGLAMTGQISYTTAEIEESDIAGIMLEVGVAWDQ